MRSCDCSSDVCASDLEALTWHHKFDALVDYRRTSGVTEKERLNTSYKGQRRIGKRLYAFGLLQYERDRPAGYYRRFSEGFGLGVRLVDQPDLRLDMDGGPAFRQTISTFGDHDSEDRKSTRLNSSH